MLKQHRAEGLESIPDITQSLPNTWLHFILAAIVTEAIALPIVGGPGLLMPVGAFHSMPQALKE